VTRPAGSLCHSGAQRTEHRPPSSDGRVCALTWRIHVDNHSQRATHTNIDGIDLTPELIETGQVLTERCKLADRVVLQVGNAETFDVVWCQNVTMNIADKAGFLAGVYRVVKPGGLFTATEYSIGPGGDIIFRVPWAYDASISFLESADVMREQYHAAGFRILEWMNYSDNVIQHYERMLNAPPNKLTNRIILGDDAPERQRNSQRNMIEGRTIYWMITAERPKL